MQQSRDDGRRGSSGAAPTTQKIRLSCDNCKLHKIRCGQERPACRRCQSHDLTCCYSPSLRMGRPRAGKPKQQEQPCSQINDDDDDDPNKNTWDHRPEPQHAPYALGPATGAAALDGQLGEGDLLLPPYQQQQQLGTSSDRATSGPMFSPLDDGFRDLPSMPSAAFTALAFSPEDSSLSWGRGMLDDPLRDLDYSMSGTQQLGPTTFPTTDLPDVTGVSVPTHTTSEHAWGSIVSSAVPAPVPAPTIAIAADTNNNAGRCGCAGELVAQTSQAISGLQPDDPMRPLGQILCWVEKLSERLSAVLECVSCSTHFSTALAACHAICVATDALLGRLTDSDADSSNNTSNNTSNKTSGSQRQLRLQLGSYLVRLEEGEEFARQLVQRRLRRLRADIERLTQARGGDGSVPDDPRSAIWSGILEELRARIGDEG